MSKIVAWESPRTYALLSIAAAVVTIGLKFGAYLVTGSVSLFGDAAESLVNLLAAVIALWALTLAARPPDDEHMYGHSKAEYFASGLEGALILIAAASIGFAAWERLWQPQPLENTGVGFIISVVAAAINGGIAIVLRRAGQRLRSITLEADARHLLTDVWTTAGVLIGVLLVQLTGWLVLDPLIALLVAINIVWTGVRLLRETGYGLLDSALPADDRQVIDNVLHPYQQAGVMFHALRTRQSGPRRFVSLHVLVPGSWTVQRGHELCDEIERAIERALPESNVTTHLEPLEDPVAWSDQTLDRDPAAANRTAAPGS
jgi:cation diffusion facilitator family transporter